MDIGNHRYTNEQNCILLKKGVIEEKNCLPPPNPKIVPTALWRTLANIQSCDTSQGHNTGTIAI